jgi:L-asparaginase
LGEIVEAKPEFYRPLPKRPESKGKRLAIPATLSRVDIILSYADVDPAIVDFFVERGAKGLILAGVGNGNTRKPMIDALARASAAGIIVVRSSRLMDGWVSRNIEIDDDALGFVAARDLNPAKARVLLKFALEKTRDPAAIQRWFDCPAPTASGECLDGAN